MMRKVKVLSLLLVLLFVMANTHAIVWTGDVSGDWEDPNNWNGGAIPGSSDSAQFIWNKPPCVLDSTGMANQLFVANDDQPEGVFLTIADGGTLTVSDYAAIGYNKTGTVIVEEGGTLISNNWMTIGMFDDAGHPGSALLQINGGTVTVKNAFRHGMYFDGTVVFNVRTEVNDGVLSVGSLIFNSTNGINNIGVMNINYGTVIVNGDHTGDVSNWVDAGVLTAFDGEGTIAYDYGVTNSGKTTITGISPMNPTPANNAMVQVNPALDLIWTNKDPNFIGDDIYVDVWFGTDPNKAGSNYTKVVDAGINTTMVQVDASVETTYYWQVDSYIYGEGHINEPNIIEGDVFTFSTFNDSPPSVVIETPDMLSWAGEPVQLNATITDDGSSPVTIEWSVAPENDPNVIFSPSPFVEDPVITSNASLGYTTVTVVVSDENLFGITGSDTMQIDFAANACHAARSGFLQLSQVYVADTNADCIIDLADFAAEIAAHWLEPYALTAPIPITANLQ